jgi:hypothetical protein
MTLAPVMRDFTVYASARSLSRVAIDRVEDGLQPLKVNFQLRLRCACAAIAMREHCDIIAAQSQRMRMAVPDQFPIANAMRRPCDVQPSMYTDCMCLELEAAFRTNGYLCVLQAIYLSGSGLFSLSPLTDRPPLKYKPAASVRYQNNDYSNYTYQMITS